MAGPLSVFDIAGRAMSAQLVRMNTTASNLANAGTVASSKEGAFRALKPVFKPVTEAPGIATVDGGRVEPPRQRRAPIQQALAAAARAAASTTTPVPQGAQLR